MAYQHVLVCFMWIFTAVSAQDVKYVLKGQDVHLVPSISERPIGILWLHNRSDVVLFFRTENVYPPYKDRVTLDCVSAELTIKNATHNDSGIYDLNLNINNKLHTFQYRIEVIDKVSKPNISCEMSDTKQATLVCSAESKHPHLLNFKWHLHGNEQTGPNLTITVSNEDDDQVYRCDVSNPLTSETASFTARDCLKDKRSDVQNAIIILSTLLFSILIILGHVLIDKWQGSNKKLTVDERVETAINLTASSDCLHSHLTSTDMNTTTQLDINKDQQVSKESAGKNVKSNDDLPSLINYRQGEGSTRSPDRSPT